MPSGLCSGTLVGCDVVWLVSRRGWRGLKGWIVWDKRQNLSTRRLQRQGPCQAQKEWCEYDRINNRNFRIRIAYLLWCILMPLDKQLVLLIETCAWYQTPLAVFDLALIYQCQRFDSNISVVLQFQGCFHVQLLPRRPFRYSILPFRWFWKRWDTTTQDLGWNLKVFRIESELVFSRYGAALLEFVSYHQECRELLVVEWEQIFNPASILGTKLLKAARLES